MESRSQDWGRPNMTDRLLLFEDLVRPETRPWNHLDVALKDEHGLSPA